MGNIILLKPDQVSSVTGVLWEAPWRFAEALSCAFAILALLLCFCHIPIPSPPPPSHIFITYLLNRVVCWCCVDSCLELGSGVWHDGNGESLTTEKITTLLLFPHLPSNITDYNPG